jgi:DNA-binding beta-propeller fold protein YncE
MVVSMIFLVSSCGSSNPDGGDTHLLGGSIQGRSVASTGVVTTVPSSFSSPFGITTDGLNLYVADYKKGLIKKIVIATGAISTLAGTDAFIAAPAGVTTDGTNLYVTDTASSSIYKVSVATGRVTKLSQSGAGFFHPYGITTDGTNLYVADSDNSTIKKIVIATGAATTLATGFSRPIGITTDGVHLYVADTGSNTIKKIVIGTGTVTTLAGSTFIGSSDGTGTTTSFNNPYGITTDGTNLFVADQGNNTIRKIVIATGVVTTLTGSPPPAAPGSADTNNTDKLPVSFSHPHGITTDGFSLYVVDTDNNTIRKIQ